MSKNRSNDLAQVLVNEIESNLEGTLARTWSQNRHHIRGYSSRSSDGIDEKFLLQRDELMPEFTNVPLDEVALRLTLSVGIAWNLERAMKIQAILGEKFVVKESHSFEQVPGMSGMQTEIQLGGITGIEIINAEDSVKILSQANLLKVSWHKSQSNENPYVRFPHLLSLMTRIHQILQELVVNDLPTLVTNMSYINKIDDGQATAKHFAERYLSESTFPTYLPLDARLNHIDSSWKLADGIDIRCQLRRIEDPSCYALVTSGGKILGSGEDFTVSLEAIRVHLHKYFLEQLSESAKVEFGLI